jgi:hypothetical protein
VHQILVDAEDGDSRCQRRRHHLDGRSTALRTCCGSDECDRGARGPERCGRDGIWSLHETAEPRSFSSISPAPTGDRTRPAPSCANRRLVQCTNGAPTAGEPWRPFEQTCTLNGR